MNISQDLDGIFGIFTAKVHGNARNPWKINLAAVAASRYPSPHRDIIRLGLEDQQELLPLVAIINQEIQNATAINWEDLSRENNKVHFRQNE